MDSELLTFVIRRQFTTVDTFADDGTIHRS